MKVKYTKSLQDYWDTQGILKLPNEILIDIFLICGPLVCYTIKQVNKRFRELVNSEKISIKWINRFIQPYFYPYKYQFEVVKFMTLKPLGCIVALEQGLGKTTTSLLYINVTWSLRNLVVCPKQLMKVWAQENKKFYGTKFKMLLAHKELDGDIRDFTKETLENYDIVVITYQCVRHLVARERDISQIYWNSVFLDEAHVLRNCPESMYPYVDALQRNKLWCLTGSLIFNSINDARNLQRLIDPSSIYSTNNIKKLRFSDVNITLPPLTVNKISTARTERANDVYNRYETKAIDLLEQLGSVSKNIAEVFTIIHRMRQISISLALLQSSHSKLGKLSKIDTWKSPRIEKAAQLIADHPGQSISFCFYRTTLDLLETNLQKRGVKCIVIKSEMKLGLRDFYIEKFVKGKYKALLMTYQCGSLGLNLTNATLVNVLSPHWNIQVIQQAFKRCYRLGQTQPVTVNMFVTENSIESRMMEICTEKEKIEEVLLAEHKNKKKLTVEEIKKLF